MSALNKGRPTTHSMSKSPEYNAWKHMKDRCYNPNNKSFHNYGQRGIKVCDEWLDSFETFYKDIGNRPSSNYSLDRINNEGDYNKNNCRWATHIQQSRNTRCNRHITYMGETKCLAEWAETLKISTRHLRNRFNKHWSVHKTFTTPIRRYRAG